MVIVQCLNAQDIEHGYLPTEMGKEDAPLSLRKRSSICNAPKPCNLSCTQPRLPSPSSSPSPLQSRLQSPQPRISKRRSSLPTEMTAQGPLQQLHKCSSSSPPSRLSHLLSHLTFFLFSLGIFIAGYQRHITSLQHEYQLLSLDRDKLQTAHRHMRDELATAHRHLQDIQSKYDKMNRSNQDMGSHLAQMKLEQEAAKDKSARYQRVVLDRERAAALAQERMNNLFQKVQDRSREELLRKFGAGPHHVQLELQLPSSSKPQIIQIEMAPHDLMPHAVHTFLSQISMGVWNNRSFNMHGGHVLFAFHPQVRVGDNHDNDGTQTATLTTTAKQPSPSNAIPSENDNDGPNSKVPPTVIIPEYHEGYPHSKYTLAFPGRREAGPSFYINLDSNSHHSPHWTDPVDGTMNGTDGNHGHYIEGEPCFGTIIKGKDVVDDMIRLPYDENGFLEQPVLIKRGWIITTTKS